MRRLFEKLRDKEIEFLMGILLIIGVIISGTIVLVGSVIYLAENQYVTTNYNIFVGEPERLKNLYQIVKGALTFHGRALIQFGLVILIATPVARVLFAVIGFYVEKDRLYTLISIFVLVVLLLSMIGGLGK